jgi:small-conductance mechanosensitive channel
MLFIDLTAWKQPLLAALVGLLATFVAYRLGRPVVYRVVRHSTLLDAVAHRLDRAVQWLLPLLVLQLVWQAVPEDTAGVGAVRHLNGLLLIAAITHAAIAAVQGVADGVVRLNPADVADNLHARRVITQTHVIARTVIGLIVFTGLAFMLMTFPRARQLGASLLASAGVVGLVAGIAARSVFGNVVAGLHIALAQPLRIDDVLIVKGEWGRVEEITGTYVVLKIWDERRLIIPLQWFMENPFENWTRSSSSIIGSVMLWVDYTTELAPLRAEAERLAKGSPDWDGRVCVLQVVDTNERAMQLRLIVSSASSGQNWDLRCLLRERLIEFLRRTQPASLPRVRAQLEQVGEVQVAQ